MWKVGTEERNAWVQEARETLTGEKCVTPAHTHMVNVHGLEGRPGMRFIGFVCCLFIFFSHRGKPEHLFSS